MTKPQNESCATCTAYLATHGRKQGICVALPPTPVFYGMQNSPIQGQPPHPIVIGHFPEVGAAIWCREYRAAPGVEMKTEGNA